MTTQPSATVVIPAVRVHDVFKVYKEGSVETVALRGVSIQVEAGEFVSILGPSGCGKSTLLNLIAGLATPTAGRVDLVGSEFSNRSEAERSVLRQKKIGTVFQSDNLFPRLSVRENVQLPARLAGVTDSKKVAQEMLDNFGVASLASRYPNELSGGERQRVAIAVSLINAPQILLADEPTGELDSRSRDVVLKFLVETNKRVGLAIIAVTHDPVVAQTADRVIQMQDGLVSDEEDH